MQSPNLLRAFFVTPSIFFTLWSPKATNTPLKTGTKIEVFHPGLSLWATYDTRVSG